MRRRGHTLLLVMTVIVAAGFSFTVAATRLSVSAGDREFTRARSQALWLARSALTAGVRGAKQLVTPEGAAAVEVKAEGARTVATVRFPGGTAVVSEGPGGWEERYQAH